MQEEIKINGNRLAALFTPGRVMVPIGLGLLVVLYFLYRDFDAEEFSKMEWSGKSMLLILVTILVFALRHLAYSWRLKILTKDYFNWKKSILLITLWEFASAISPTSLGGSATAMVLLAQERLPGAKIVTLVLYTVILDTAFVILSFILYAIFLGPIFIYPNATSFMGGGFVLSFWIVFGLMCLYCFFFFYGIFINTKQISRFLHWLSKRRALKRFSEKLATTAVDIQSASKELRKKSWAFHAQAFLATSIAWFFKFATLSFLVFAIFPQVQETFYHFIHILARNQAMFAITAFSPTPGGSGVTEALFGGFFKDYVSESGSPILALIWRLITYYSYVMAGAIMLPLWIRSLIQARKKNKA